MTLAQYTFLFSNDVMIQDERKKKTILCVRSENNDVPASVNSIIPDINGAFANFVRGLSGTGKQNVSVLNLSALSCRHTITKGIGFVKIVVVARI